MSRHQPATSKGPVAFIRSSRSREALNLYLLCRAEQQRRQAETMMPLQGNRGHQTCSRATSNVRVSGLPTSGIFDLAISQITLDNRYAGRKLKVTDWVTRSRLDSHCRCGLSKARRWTMFRNLADRCRLAPTRQSHFLQSFLKRCESVWKSRASLGAGSNERKSLCHCTAMLRGSPANQQPTPYRDPPTLFSHQAWASRRRSTLPATAEVGCPLHRDIRDLVMRLRESECWTVLPYSVEN